MGRVNLLDAMFVNKEIARKEVMACDYFILMPDHYSGDGTCRCTDEDHEEMSDWGYIWRDGKWRAEQYMPHHNVKKQIRLAVDVGDMFLVWSKDRTYENRQEYIRLKSKMDEYEPDPTARF